VPADAGEPAWLADAVRHVSFMHHDLWGAEVHEYDAGDEPVPEMHEESVVEEIAEGLSPRDGLGEDPRAHLLEDTGGFTVLCNEIATADLEKPEKDQDTMGAVKIGPSYITPQTYTNAPENLASAVEHRVTAKINTFSPTPEEKARLMNFTKCTMRRGTNQWRGIFTKGAIEEWARNNPDLKELKSSKWSEERMAKAIEDLHAHMGPIEPKFAIKCEALPPKGKAPRMLIADGEVGQVCSLLTIRCFEDLLFARFHDHSIKHRSSDDALTETLTRMRGSGQHDQQLCEGDGSAWDTTVSEGLRDMTENDILWHITAILADVSGIPREWGEKAMALNTKKKFKVKAKAKDKFTGLLTREVSETIAAFRRSGHRGTSCLNWWINFTVWHCILTTEPELALDPTRRWYPSALAGGGQVFVDYVMEGDDSLLCTRHVQEHSEEIAAAWHRYGFNMKLVWPEPGRHATVVGYNVYVDRRGPVPEEMMPEPMRGLVSSAWSTSSILKQEIRDGNGSPSYHGIAASSYLARYTAMAGRFPEMANIYRACAMFHMLTGKNMVTDHETSMKLTGKADLLPLREVLERADALGCTRRPCTRLRKSLGLTSDAVTSARMMSMDVFAVDDDQLLREMIPSHWK